MVPHVEQVGWGDEAVPDDGEGRLGVEGRGGVDHEGGVALGVAREGGVGGSEVGGLGCGVTGVQVTDPLKSHEGHGFTLQRKGFSKIKGRGIGYLLV